ncbi:MAG TPA: farnesyl diphosphate synthase [Thermoanaerobaculia bacterium]|nr:farnesyl diphosphate synthase [Thermoanaerobaculia bacterium]
MTLGEYLAERRALIDRTLNAQLPPADTPPAVIHEAMRYAVLGGGKRVRPILAIAAAEACGADAAPLVGHFAALELIHTYSLVHDDLPALDNDDYRRGRKTTHVVFGEAMGILTGDALLTEAFAWLSRPLDAVPAERQLRALGVVAEAVDSRGMIGGQVADILSERATEPSLEQLQFIHRNKTGKLLTASVLLGGLLGGATEQQLESLEAYGVATGLAFQIVDDLLDIEATSADLGKTAGKDVAQGKLTYPALLGVEAARAEAGRLLAVAIENADNIAGPAANYLAEIARYICERRS